MYTCLMRQSVELDRALHRRSLRLYRSGKVFRKEKLTRKLVSVDEMDEKGGGVRITSRNDNDLMSGLVIERTTVTAQWVSFGFLTLAVGFHYQNGVQMTIPTKKAPHLDTKIL